jgi:hypothetical protein
MATNEILTFAGTDTGTNLLTQAAYAADAQRTIGNQPGIARAQLVNKAFRQASTVAAGLAQFVADNQATNVTDSLTAAQFAALVVQAIQAQSNPVGSLRSELIVFPGYLELNGALLTRATYPELFAFASDNSLLVTEAVWSAGRYGIFSDGDGSTTFRLPDFRGETIRILDSGRGVDAGRLIGQWQDWETSFAKISSDYEVTGPGANLQIGVTGAFNFIPLSGLGGTETRARNLPLRLSIKY